MEKQLNLRQLGWQPFFQQQLSLEEYDQYHPFRISSQHKASLTLLGEKGEFQLAMDHRMPPLTVGDWILCDNEKRFIRVLERSSLFQRKAAGSKLTEQLIAANIDTAFIVSSMNQDFNLNRIERYLTMAHEAEVEPVVVLTKKDLCDNPDEFRKQVQKLDPLLMVEPVNGLDRDSVHLLLPWCRPGKTVALLGSSGAGKSTLTNSLVGHIVQNTRDIREDDAKGRHTTTARSLFLMPEGGILLDTPGMRELQLTESEQGIAGTFADILELAAQCRFSDCTHQNEPGCAIRAAIESGELEERRLLSFEKLNREQARNSASLAEKRSQDKALGKFYREVQSHNQARKKGR